MADPFGIIGLVATGFKIGKGLYKLANAFASSGQEIRAYGDEVTGFAQLLNRVHIELTRTVHVNSNVLEVQSIVNICVGVLKPFNRLQEKLNPLISRLQTQEPRWSISFRNKFSWVFSSKKELLFWRSILAEQRRNLDTALLVLLLQGNREVNAQIKHVLEASLRKSITAPPITENDVVSVEGVDCATDARSVTSRVEVTAERSEAAELRPSTSTPEHDAKDGDVVSPENMVGPISDAHNDASYHHAVGELALTTVNQENSLVLINKLESSTIEELVQVVQECLDPDEGAYMHSMQKHVQQATQRIEEMAVQVLYALNQDSIDLNKRAVVLNGGKYIIGIVCARTVEFAAMRSMMTQIQPPSTRNAFQDGLYIFGRIGPHEVALTCLPSQHEAFKPYDNMFQSIPSMLFAISVGVASGCPTSRSDIRLGDVVIGQPRSSGEAVLCYLPGEEFHFRKAAELPDILLKCIKFLQASHEFKDSKVAQFMHSSLEQTPKMARDYGHPGLPDLLFPPDYLHQDIDYMCRQCDPSRATPRIRRESEGPELHYGTIASIQKNIKDSNVRDSIAESYGVFCIDSAGSEVSCELPILVVRGINDYADSHAGPIWRRYAALAAAAYVQELLMLLPQSSRRSANADM